MLDGSWTLRLAPNTAIGLAGTSVPNSTRASLAAAVFGGMKLACA